MIFSWTALRSFLLLALLAGGATRWLADTFTTHPLWIWLGVLNAVTLIWFGKDKIFSLREGLPRTPEGAFILLGLTGAFPALLAGMYIFKHKHSKPRFWVPMAFYMLVQIGILYYFLDDLTPWLANNPFTNTMTTAINATPLSTQ